MREDKFSTIFRVYLVMAVSFTSTAFADYVSESQLKPLNKTDTPFEIAASLRAHLNLNAHEKVSPFKSRPNKILLVFQETFGLLDSNKNYDFIGSLGAFPCINVALYDDKTQKIALGHFDASTKYPEAVKAMIGRFPKGQFTPSRAILASESGPMYWNLEELINSFISLRITQIDYLKSNTLIVSRQGQIYTNWVHSDETEDYGYTKRVGLATLPGSDCRFQKTIVGKAGLAEGCATK